MKNISYKTFIWTNLIILLITQLPFIPGPDFLFKPAVYIFYFFQISSFFLAPLLAIICLVWAGYALIFANQKLKNVCRHFLFLIGSLFLTSLLSTWVLQEYSREFSRKYTIRQAQEIILKIDHHKRSYRHYPQKLDNLLEDIPSPKIIGIKKWNYGQKNDWYVLHFEQVGPVAFWNTEKVFYDPSGNYKLQFPHISWEESSDSYWRYYIYD